MTGDELLPTRGERLGGALWESLVREPRTGVTIVTLDGRIRFINGQAVRMFYGEGVTPEDVVGHDIADDFPREWVDERLALMERCARERRAYLLRTIWQGFQQLSWAQPIESDDGSGPTEVLVVTRRIAGDDEASTLIPSEHEVIESGVMRLGPLDVLSHRELEVLALLGQGLTIKEIAGVLHRSVHTIERHRESIGRKLEASDRVKLASIASAAGLSLRDAERKRV